MEWHRTYGSFDLHRTQLEVLDQALADRILAALPHPRLSFSLEYTLYQGDRRRTVDHPGAIATGVRLDALTLRLRILKEWDGLRETEDFRQERQAVHQAGQFLQDLGVRFVVEPSPWVTEAVEVWVLGQEEALVTELGMLIEAWFLGQVQRRSGRAVRGRFWRLWGGSGVGMVAIGVLLGLVLGVAIGIGLGMLRDGTGGGVGFRLLGPEILGTGAIGPILLGGTIGLLLLAHQGHRGWGYLSRWLWHRDRPSRFRF
ncbi:MAG: hypothetical protein ACO4AI_09200 [Prochlorothrix sp.]